ncbi:MAG TPA: prepilin-type N-terminal cleavage/methylation domain-containing protein [Coleofasciculaceae cyanobacterium]
MNVQSHPAARAAASQPAQSTEAGFSLLEVLVVVIMIGVLAAIAGPSWLAFMNRQRLTAANDQILQAVRQAQAEAKRTHSKREVRFDPAANPPRIAVLPVPSSGTPTPNGQITNWQTLGQGEIKPGLLSLAVSPPTATSLVFDPQGVVIQPEIENTPFIATVSLSGSTVKRCTKIPTILGAVSQECN